MSDENLTIKQLLDKVSRLETEIQSLKAQKNLLGNNAELIVWGTNAAIWSWNYESGKLTFSDKLAELLGYKPNELDSGVFAFTKMLHPDDYDSTMDNMKNLLTGKTDIYEVEYRIKAKNGEWRWFFNKGKIAD
jgi:PAS domain S-box-containing protein